MYYRPLVVEVAKIHVHVVVKVQLRIVCLLGLSTSRLSIAIDQQPLYTESVLMLSNEVLDLAAGI